MVSAPSGLIYVNRATCAPAYAARNRAVPFPESARFGALMGRAFVTTSEVLSSERARSPYCLHFFRRRWCGDCQPKVLQRCLADDALKLVMRGADKEDKAT